MFRSWAASFSPKWGYWKVEISRAFQRGIKLISCWVLWERARLLTGYFFVNFFIVLMLFSSLREEVGNHCVKWGKDVTFPCKMTANVSTGVLDTCSYRVSIRKVGGRRMSLLILALVKRFSRIWPFFSCNCCWFYCFTLLSSFLLVYCGNFYWCFVLQFFSRAGLPASGAAKFYEPPASRVFFYWG